MGNISAKWISMTLLAGLAACGGGGGGGPEPAVDPASRQNTLAVSRPGELVAYVQARLRQRGTAPGLATDVAAAPAGSALPGISTTPRSGTTLQEAGVDEPDLLQSRGDALYSLAVRVPSAGSTPRAEVQALRRDAQGQAVRAGAAVLPSDDAYYVAANGMVLSDDGRTLAVLNQRWLSSNDGAGIGCADLCPATGSLVPYVWFRSSLAIQRVDVTDPAAVQAGERLVIDGQLVAARRVGDQLVVVSTWTPRLPVDALPASASAADREAAIARTTAADVLPRVRRNGGAPQALLSDTDCWTQPGNGSPDVQVTTVTLLDLRATDFAPKSRCFVGGTQAMYMSTGHLYLATTRWTLPAGGGLVAFPGEVRTDVHKFALGEQGLSYRATGEVAGHLGWDPNFNSYRFSEHNGDLRVVSFTGSMGWASSAETAVAPSPARLTVLRETTTGSTLQAVATLPNAQRPALLGKPGEQVRAVRFIGDRGYIVTFRQVDPLYVLDLSDPLDPKTAGVLEVPGFSDQLLPLSDGLLLGVGRDVDASTGRMAGLKVALFDVHDASQPRELASTVLGAAGSGSALDGSPHGINALVANGQARVALPVSLIAPGSASWQRSLQRFEVDLAARTLRTLAPLATTAEQPWNYIDERSLQIGGQLYHLRDAAVSTYDW